MKKRQDKYKHKTFTKGKVYIIATLCVGLIIAVSFIVKQYTTGSKSDIDNSPNNSVVEPIEEQENINDSMAEESNTEDTSQELTPNNIETPEAVTQEDRDELAKIVEEAKQDELNGVQTEEPTESRMQAPQGGSGE
ncbi:hypothetical protein [Clostridium vincentii]|uniref:Uncharacterized protein n=1 Tax=Clostridium vincentii TaxID=52704 RepID=A0A2T0BE03_9CLOT|nr:hypothetical protein [Clostridium vincentii]PRR82099.1 hypothetical protein CLVI_20340 [Clostridium vincentii]